jgi:hypothetical protein
LASGQGSRASSKTGGSSSTPTPLENQIRPIALTRKNALFAGHEVGAENWAMLAPLVATCKMSDVNPIDYIAQTLRAILDGHPRSRIEDLMPWCFDRSSSLAV